MERFLEAIAPQRLAEYWQLLRDVMDAQMGDPWGDLMLASVPACAVVALWVRFVVNPLRRKR